MDFANIDWLTVFNIISGVIAVASLITALTPTQVDDNIVSTLKKVVDFLALNVVHAKAPAVVEPDAAAVPTATSTTPTQK